MRSTCCLDFGNTQLKVAFFNEREFESIEVFQTLPETISFLKSTSFDYAILSSVLADHENQFFLSQIDFEPLILNRNTKLPIFNAYGTPDSLGNDRLANACFTNTLNEKSNFLVIDTGTCLKFDFVTKSKEYLGGSIGPGLIMRFKALNNYTGKLPLLSYNDGIIDLVGDDTYTSILSGVQLGMEAEINGLIQSYESKYNDLTIFITGGDLNKFELKSKNTIFADQLITLKGLNEVLLFNI